MTTRIKSLRVLAKRRLATWRADRKIKRFVLKLELRRSKGVMSKLRIITSRYRLQTKMFAVFTIALLVIQPLLSYSPFIPEAGALSGNDVVSVDGDNSVNFVTLGGTSDGSCSGGTHCDYVDEASLNSADYVSSSTGSATYTEDFTTENPTINGTLTSVTKVDVTWNSRTMACNGTGGTPCDGMTVNIFIDGALRTGQTTTLTTTQTTYTTTFTGTWTTANDLRILFTRVANGGGGSRYDDVRLYQSYATVYFDYNKVKPLLSLEDYIWENPDGADAQQTSVSTGALGGSDSSNAGTGTWTNPTYANFNYSNLSNDDATIAVAPFDFSQYLKLSGFAFDIPKGATIDGISVRVDKYTSGLGSGEDEGVFLIKNASTFSSDRGLGGYWATTETTYNYGSSSDLWGLSLTPEEINSNLEFVISVREGFGASGITAYVNFVQITVYYTPAQTTQLAAANTSITMRKGEQATLRANLRNVGGPVDIENFGLFYDRNDGIWTKVDSSDLLNIESGSNCDVSEWNCTNLGTPSSGVRSPKIAIDKSGTPWAAFMHNNNDLYVAQYVGIGGSGCSGTTEWQCTLIDSGSFNSQVSITFDSANNPWVAYGNFSDGDPYVARFVGGGGSGCNTALWTCQAIFSGTNSHSYPSIATGPSGFPVVAFQDATGSDLVYAEHLGGATTGTGCAINTWNCTTVMTAGTVGVDAEITVDNSGNAWIAHRDTGNSDALWVSYYDGDATPSGCAVNSWTCTLVQTTNNVPQPSIAVGPDNRAFIAFRNGSSDLELAEFVGTGGGGCNSGAWNCTVIDDSGASNGLNSDIAIDPSGNIYIAHFDNSNGKMKVARQHKGLTSGTGCTINTWTCTAIDSVGTSNLIIAYGIAVDPDGRPWVAYNSSSDNNLYIASFDRRGEISLANSQQFTSKTILDSHTDMTSTTDSGNRNDADCTTSATWNDGVHFDGDTVSSDLIVADGQGTAQCTEIAWNIDTSQALEGETYRFVIATDDAVVQSKGKWRGMVAIENYPTIIIEDESLYDTTQWIEKADNVVIDPCGSANNWGCEYINNGSFDSGHTPTLRIASDGTIWNSWAWNNVLVASKYTGSGGIGCENLSTWDCTFIDSAGSIYYNDMALDSKGNPWIVYTTDTGSLKLATYDGDATSSGCLNVAWTCTTIDTITSGSNVLNSIAINLNDQKWLVYESGLGSGSLQIAHYVGSGGTGCASGVTDWTCSELDSVATTSYVSPSLAIGQDGNPWVNYMEPDGNTLYYARYVGSGGTGCTLATFTCGVLFDDGAATFTNSRASKITVGGPDNKVNSFFATTTGTRFAEYVGTGGTGCGAGNTAWSCSVIDTSGSGGADGAYDAAGNLWVAFGGTSTGVGANIAKYVGTGGTGCAGASTVWTCTNVGTGFLTYTPDIAFDAAGAIWFIGQIVTLPRYSPVIFKYDYPMTKPTRTTVNNIYEYGKHATKSGGLVRLNSGRSPYNASALLCVGNNGDTGYCGLTANDGQVDSTLSKGRAAPTVTSGARFKSNSVVPNISWIGKSTLAPSTTDVDGDLVLQVYRFGTTNAWETIATDDISTDCWTDNCSISGMPSGTASEYFEADGSNYWVYVRVIQVDSYGSNIVFETDSLSITRSDQQLRGGRTFNRNLTQPLTR